MNEENSFKMKKLRVLVETFTVNSINFRSENACHGFNRSLSLDTVQNILRTII